MRVPPTLLVRGLCVCAAVLIFVLPARAQTIFYSQNFESLPAGQVWTAQTSSSATVNWHVSAAAAGEGSQSLHLGKSTSPFDYDDGTRVVASALTPLIALPPEGGTLTFQLRKVTQNSQLRDQLTVDVLNAGGSVLSTYQFFGEYTAVPWVTQTLALPYANGGVFVRFRFDSIDATANNFAGVFIDNIIVSEVSGCVGPNTVAASGRCYTFVNQSMFPTHAEAYCTATYGGLLASIPDADANAAVTGIIGPNTAWIGLSDQLVENTFVWNDGQPLTYANWSWGEPNNAGDEDCVSMLGSPFGASAGMWNDVGCGNPMPFVCQYAAAPPAVPPPVNRPPMANAGPDQALIGCSGCDTAVTLNGTSSSDPDGSALTYRWTEGGTLLATTTDPIATATVILPIGVHTIQLTVNDSSNAAAADTVIVTILDPAGTIGPAGPIGPVGPMGPMGPEGPMGPMGPTGATGATGATGPQGDGVLQGSLMMLPAGSPAPSPTIYQFVGSFTMMSSDVKKKETLAVDVYRRR